VNVTVPVSFSLFTFKPTAGLYMKIDVINEDGVNIDKDGNTIDLKNPTLFGYFDIDNFFFTGGGSIAFSKDPIYLSAGYKYDWMIDSFLPGKTETDFHEVTVDMNVNFAKLKIPFIEDMVISLSGGAKFITDGNLSWSAGAQVANNVQILREPAIDLNIILDFIYEDTRDAPAAVPDYWTPEESLKTGLTLGFTLIPVINNNISLSEQFWVNADFYSNGSDNLKGMSFEFGNRFEFTKRDFTTFLNAVLTFDYDFNSFFKGSPKYWAFTLEVGVNALFPDYLKP
ncbi:MAG: hypothetical protein PF518_12670, partial [Spirochaetaceae bacterium]|nr:hypothetical protein [Spirochaetaceae bacterium]